MDSNRISEVYTKFLHRSIYKIPTLKHLMHTIAVDAHVPYQGVSLRPGRSASCQGSLEAADDPSNAGVLAVHTEDLGGALGFALAWS